MNRIEKPKNFFRDNLPYLMGVFWMILGFVSYLLGGSMPYRAYLIIGFAGIIFGYISRKSRREFIAWDSEKIVSKDQINGKLTYKWSEIDDIVFSDQHLTIKSGAANGTMLELKDFHKEDRDKLYHGLNGAYKSTLKPTQ